MKKTLLKIKSDRAAKNLLKRDLSEYLNQENFRLATFEFAPKNKSVTLRLSDGLLKAVKMSALKQGTNYQRIIRQAIELFLRNRAA